MKFSFGEGLLQDFSLGKMTGVQVRETAERAVRWCEEQGGQLTKDDVVFKIASAGTRGAHPQNIERDLHHILFNLGESTVMKTKVSVVKARHYNFHTGETFWRDTSIVYPDDILLSLWNQGETVWKQCLTGSASPSEFWGRVLESSPWIQHHPALHRDKEKLIPISLYGDEVQAFKNTEAGVVSVLGFSSDLSFNNHPLMRYFLISVYAEQTACEETFHDILKAITPRLQRLVSEDADYPWSKAGWGFAYSSTQGDLKYIVEKWGFNNYRKNDFCARCPCQKQNDNIGLTLGNFRADAEHMRTRWVHKDYIEWTNPEDRSVLFDVPGVLYERFLHDCCHGQLLGTGKLLNGSALVYLLERGFFAPWPARGEYKDQLASLLKLAHSNFNSWKKQHKLTCTQPRFTVARLNRRLRQSFPCLSSKAVTSKILTFWLADLTRQQAEKSDATLLDGEVAVCLWGYARGLQVLDQSNLCMEDHQKREFFDCTLLHLQTYANLHKQSSEVVGTNLNRCLWQLVPKHHHFLHCAEDTLITGLNPKMSTLLSAESWIGIMGRISKKCHRSSVDRRAIQRYLATLYFHIKGAVE